MAFGFLKNTSGKTIHPEQSVSIEAIRAFQTNISECHAQLVAKICRLELPEDTGKNVQTFSGQPYHDIIGILDNKIKFLEARMEKDMPKKDLLEILEQRIVNGLKNLNHIQEPALRKECKDDLLRDIRNSAKKAGIDVSGVEALQSKIKIKLTK